MDQYFFIRVDKRYVKINFQDLLYIEADSNYIKLVTETTSLLVLFTMKRMEQLLPSNFRRIHKSYIVSLDKINSFDTDKVYLAGKTLPLGNEYRSKLKKGILFANSVKTKPSYQLAKSKIYDN